MEITRLCNNLRHERPVFPDTLFDFDYPAPGAPDVAREIAHLVMPAWVGLDRKQWGLDHGTWSMLAHLYPQIDGPVVQLSINALRPLNYHVDIAAWLAPLHDSGVMIPTSSNVVHYLSAAQWNRPNAAFYWAERFDDAVVAQLADAPGDMLKIREYPDYAPCSRRRIISFRCSISQVWRRRRAACRSRSCGATRWARSR